MLSSLQLTPVKYGIIALTLFTAGVHFFLGDIIFLLNGLGYLTLLTLFILPVFAKWQTGARWLLIAYTAVTIIGYFIIHRDGSWQMDGLGVMTKVAEVILVLLLFYELQPPLESDRSPER